VKRVIDLRKTPPASRAAALGAEASTRDAQHALDSHAFAFITVVNNETQYATCLRYVDALQVPPGYSVEKIVVFGATSMAEGCQRGMEASTARYKVYLHQDLYLVYQGLLSELLHLFSTYPRLGLVGVEGATRLPHAILYSVNNPFHCYGRHWTYRRPGGLSSVLGRANRRRLHFNRFRSFVGDYLPAVVVDGFFMATQYDMPWTSPVGGFELYDEVRAAEFIAAGLEVGIARQQMTWVLHWGSVEEPTAEQRRRRQRDIQQKAATFRRLFAPFVGVAARTLYERHWGAGRAQSSDAARERLGVIIAARSSPETLTRSLRTLLPQCEALKEIESQVVVVDTAPSAGVREAIRVEFPQVTVLASSGTDGVARALNEGLRHLDFPTYVLVMHSDVEVSTGTLARMVSDLRGRSSAAGVVASLMSPDGSVQPQRMAIVELVPQRPPQRAQQVTFVGTACALIRGEAFFDVGLYDERFSSHEDLDWSLRAKRKGYKLVYLPEARAVHYRSERVGRDEPAFTDRSVATLLLVYKHAGRRWAGLLYWAQGIQAGWLARRWRHDGAALRQINDARVQAENLYRKFREENRRPQLL
jgi:GT2 family glycosyltransferase